MFPYDLCPSPSYDKGVLISSRGCPYKCTYCSQRLVTGLTYRFHSLDRIIENIDLLVYKHNEKKITFDEKSNSAKSFFRKGIVDDWESELPIGVAKLIERNFDEEMRNLHYL